MLKPANELELAAMVAEAGRTNMPLEIVGGGTRRYGNRTELKAQLSTAALSGITLYEPASLTLSARAGTPVAQVVAALAAEGQHLPFEPADFRNLLGTSGEPTIGGMAATAAAGPRRVQAGSVRDSAIGVRFVDGSGTIIKNGGRVMKNVTGYDLVKLMCGSFGTLGVLTEVTFKLLPRPETVATLILHALPVDRAVEAMSTALTSPFDVNGAAHQGSGESARTFLRIEGFEASIAYRSGRLQTLLAPFGEALVERSPAANLDIWKSVRDCEPFANAEGAVWRLSVRPSAAAAIVTLLETSLGARAMLDWGGGLIWLLVPGPGDGAAVVRSQVPGATGHATLVRTATLLSDTPVFQPQSAAVEALSAGLRRQFDPKAIFNRGRMEFNAV